MRELGLTLEFALSLLVLLVLVPLGIRVRTGRVIPVNGRVGEIGHWVVGYRTLVELQIDIPALDVVGDREGAIVECTVMDPRVAGEAIEGQISAELRPVGGRLATREI